MVLGLAQTSKSCLKGRVSAPTIASSLLFAAGLSFASVSEAICATTSCPVLSHALAWGRRRNKDIIGRIVLEFMIVLGRTDSGHERRNEKILFIAINKAFFTVAVPLRRTGKVRRKAPSWRYS